MTEARRGLDCDTIPCPVCGGEARRSAVYAYQSIQGETVSRARRRPRNEVTNKHGKVMLSRFEEATQELDYAHKKREEQEGKTLKSPPYWRMAKERARKITEAGEAKSCGLASSRGET